MPPLVRNRWMLCFARVSPACCSVVAAGLLALTGCDGNSPQTAPPATDATAPAPATDVSPSQDAAAAPAASEAPAAGAAAAGETAAAVKLASWQEITAQVTAAGRPAVLDIWALSCEPCLKEFPGLVRLHKELGDQVACYAANIEFDGRKTRPPETYRQPVEAFLTSVGATLPSFISTTSSDDIYTDADIDSIPAVIVYDADGSIVKKFVDAGDTAGFTYDKDVIPLVRQLLADN